MTTPVPVKASGGAFVSNRSVPATVKAMLVAVVPGAAGLARALGFDYGATDETERVVRELVSVGLAYALIALAVSLYAHFKRDTTVEPVAVTVSIGATIGATLNFLLGFDVWSEAVILSIEALLLPVLAVIGITVVRDRVWPQENVLDNPNVEPADAFHAEAAPDPEAGESVIVTIAAVIVIIIGVLLLIAWL